MVTIHIGHSWGPYSSPPPSSRTSIQGLAAPQLMAIGVVQAWKY